MPRRNQRTVYEPLSSLPDVVITPTVPEQRRWLSPREWEEERDRRWQRTRERNERRAKQRVAAAITDWAICCIPGCERPSTLKSWWGRETHPADTDDKLPVCFDHATVIWRMIQSANGDPTVIETTHMLQAKATARAKAEHEQAKATRMASLDGDIYFVRINDLIKVGWSRDVYDRVKSYGASAELLCCYPATRDDETHLHRQLRPALAKGREWYHDGQVIQMFLTEARKNPGSWLFEVEWTEPKDVINGRRRANKR